MLVDGAGYAAGGRVMMITVVALMCHSLAGITSPVCHEEIVVKDEMPMQACLISQAAIADWKERSLKYRGSQWIIGRVRCIPGSYEPKDSIWPMKSA
jgi:hypothetical protein